MDKKMDEELSQDQFEEIINKCSWLKNVSDPVEKVLKIHIEDAIPKGFNYSGRLLRIIASVKHKSGKESKISVVHKRTPLNQSQCDFMADHGLFVKETRTYDDILSKMEQIMLNSRNNQIELDWPKHFTINKNDSILLQDLKECGYNTIKQREATYEEGILVVKTIAKLHALSIILVDESNLDINNYRDNNMAQSHTIIEFVYIASLRAIIDAIRETKQTNLFSYADIMEANLNKIEPALNKLVIDCFGEHDVLNHGDCWLNNIMFKYSSNNKPESIKLIDFQLCYYNSLAWDLSHFIYCSYLRDNRELYKTKLIAQYRTTLVQTLQLYGGDSKINSLPSVEDITKSLDRINLFSLLVGLATVPRMIPGISSHLDLDITQPDEAHKSKTKLYSIPQVMNNISKDFQELCNVIEKVK